MNRHNRGFLWNRIKCTSAERAPILVRRAALRQAAAAIGIHVYERWQSRQFTRLKLELRAGCFGMARFRRFFLLSTTGSSAGAAALDFEDPDFFQVLDAALSACL